MTRTLRPHPFIRRTAGPDLPPRWKGLWGHLFSPASHRRWAAIGACAVVALAVVACSTTPPEPTPSPTETATPASTPTPEPTPTPEATPTTVADAEPTPTPELDALFLYTQAVQLLTAGMYKEAIPPYSSVIRRIPDFGLAYHGRALAYYHEERLQLALDDFDKTIELKPGFADAYRNRAIVHRDRGDTDMAADDLEKALELYRRGANMAASAEVSGLLESLKE